MMDETIPTSLHNLSAKRYELLRQVGRQLVIEGKANSIDRKITLLEQRTRDKLDSLDSYQNRLLKLKQQLHSVPVDQVNAQSEVDRELHNLNPCSSFMRTTTTVCKFCGSRFLRSVIKDHEASCSISPSTQKNREICQNKNNITSTQINASGSINENIQAEVKPQPPRNLKIVETTCSSIKITWENPILSGGAKLYDFDVSYVPCIIEKTGKRIKRRNQVNKSLQCSRWCLTNPVPNCSLTLENLVASTCYSGIKLRCRNQIGWSDYSIPISTTRTSEPSEPLPPQRLQILNVTSNSIEFKWAPPFHCSGGVLSGYEIRYEEELPKENQIVGTNGQSKQIEKKTNIIRVAANVNQYCLSGLHGDTIYSGLKLRSFNNFHLYSDFIGCIDIKTLVPTRLYIIEKEIDRVSASKEEYIDSDIFQAGVMQREEKIVYLEKLKSELALLKKESCRTMYVPINRSDNSYENDASSFPKCTINTGVGSFVNNIIPDYEIRKSKFSFRINSLKKDISASKTSLTESATRRVFLSRQMKQSQQRILELDAELDRLSLLSGKSVTSNVFHGAEQRFDLQQLKKEAKKELENLHTKIADWKAEIIHSQKYTKDTQKLISFRDNQLKERIAAFQSFVKIEKIALKNVEGFDENSRQLISQSFSTWRRKCESRKNISTAFEKIFAKTLKIAFRKWNFTRIDGHVDPIIDDKKSNLFSKGGILLEEIEAAKTQNIDSTKLVIKHIFSLKSRFSIKSTNCLGDQRSLDKISNKLEQPDLLFFIRGDTYFEQKQYDSSKSCYETIASNLSKTTYDHIETVDKITLKCLINIKLGNIYSYKSQVDVAIAHYESALFMTKHIRSIQYSIHALLGLGGCYIEMENYHKAKESYLEVISKCLRNKDQTNEAIAHRNLAVCYEKLDNDPYVELSMAKYNILKNRRKMEIFNAYNEMDHLKKRLVNVTAKSGQVTTIQRKSLAFLKLEVETQQLTLELREKEQKCLTLKDRNVYLDSCLDQLNEELNEALTTTKSSMTSSLVHENCQIIDTRELIVRLKELKEETEQNLKENKLSEQSLSLDIKNIYDNMACLKQDMEREQSTLMQRVMKKNTIRRMALNASNTACNDVAGISSRGIDFFVISIENDLYVHEISSGNIQSCFMGDCEGNHLAKPRGHTSLITCICFRNSRIYSGSMDKSIMCWEIKDHKRIYVCHGHDATVTCIDVNDEILMSGSADTTIIFWDRNSGEQLKRINGHCRGVLCVNCGISFSVSGDTDGNIMVWDNNLFQYKYQLKSKLKAKITAVKFGQLEIVCGTNLGDVIIWWIQTGEILHRCQAHNGPVIDLQFDATRIVTCGMDCNIHIVDIMTGEVLQTLRGHGDIIMSIAFDSNMILSLSCDGTIRKWRWNISDDPKMKKELHTFQPKNSRIYLNKKYKVSAVNSINPDNSQDIGSDIDRPKLIVNKSQMEMELLIQNKVQKRKELAFESSKDDIDSSLAKRIATYSTT